VAAWLAAQANWPAMAVQARQRVEGQTEQHMVAQMLACIAACCQTARGCIPSSEAGMMKASRFPGRALIFLSLLLRLPWQWLRRKPQPEQVQRVLILHQFLLGDALMATSLLAKAGSVIRRLISSWPARPVRQHFMQANLTVCGLLAGISATLPRCASCLPCRVSTWCC
jgi:hypothetical protein